MGPALQMRIEDGRRQVQETARRGASGSAVLEFSLMALLFWGILSGCFRIAYSAYIYSSLVSAVDGGARYASRVDFDASGLTFIAKIANMAAFGSPDGTGSPLAPGLTAANIAVTWSTDTKGTPLTMTVAVAGYSVNSLFQTFTFSRKPSVTVRYAGSYKP